MKPQSQMQRFRSLFSKEAEIHIQELNKGLLSLEDNPKDKGTMEEVRRRAHTLKGAAKMVGLADVSNAAHSMEDLLDGAMTESPELDGNLFDKLFHCLDSIKALMRGEANEESVAENRALGKSLSEESEDTANASRSRDEVPIIQDAIFVETDKLDSLAGAVGEMVMDQIKSENQVAEFSRIADLVRQQSNLWSQIEERISLDLAPRHENQALGKLEQRESEKSFLSSAFAAYELQDEQINRFGNISISILNDMMDLMDGLKQHTTHRKSLVDRLQDDIKSMRLIPISVVFDAFPRAVRDLSREYNKEIKLSISGGEIKLDTSIIEAIKDPLTHLVRNAVDHGIEKPEERIRQGKPRTGNISLSAYHRGGKVIIEISDDGRGVDVERVKQAALQKGHIEESHLKAMDEASAIQLIFLPGISTSSMITDVSGRGIGMDVVMENIGRKLKGMVDVETEMAKGTKISLVVPVTLTVMQVLLIGVGREIFAIPTEAISKNIRLARDQIISVEGKQVVIDNEKVVPLVFLGEVLGSPRESMEDDSDTISVFIMEHAQKQIGFCVDGFVGEQEVVIKSLGSFLKRTPYVTGAAVLGNGDVVAILHVSGLMNAARSRLTGIVSSQQLVTDQEIQERAKAASILVVDDSLTTRELEKSILEASGYDVYVAVDGMDGLSKVSEGEFDLIVSDVEMPRMDGFQMVEMLKQSERSKDIPVIMVTALQKDEEKRRGMEVGASAYIVKSSFDQSNLLDTIQALIG